MTERRFNEAEVAAIFERATNAQHTSQRQLPSGEGMTLAELQDIGREVGIAPDLIGQAAQVVGQSGHPTSRSFLGLPLGVGRTVDLDRKLTEDEWERLVVDLRETFEARGTVKREGSLRQWTNGNLQVLLEPTATGQRIRLRTVKGDARGMMIVGIGAFGLGATLLGSAVVAGATGDPGMISSLVFLASAGAAAFGISALRLPSWARQRGQQMEEIAGRAARLANSPPQDSRAK